MSDETGRSYGFVIVLCSLIAVACAWVALGTDIWVGFRILAGVAGAQQLFMVWRAFRLSR
jgi:hypothetical protein